MAMPHTRIDAMFEHRIKHSLGLKLSHASFLVETVCTRVLKKRQDVLIFSYYYFIREINVECALCNSTETNHMKIVCFNDLNTHLHSNHKTALLHC